MTLRGTAQLSAGDQYNSLHFAYTVSSYNRKKHMLKSCAIQRQKAQVS